MSNTDKALSCDTKSVSLFCGDQPGSFSIKIVGGYGLRQRGTDRRRVYFLSDPAASPSVSMLGLSLDLLDNALKYSQPGTTVRVTLASGVLRICDGQGIGVHIDAASGQGTRIALCF